MKEASLVKFYFAKYFLLVFGLVQWLIGAITLNQRGDLPKGQFTAFLFFTTGLIFISLFLLVVNKIKRVAVGKKKVAVIDADKTHCYDWPEVKYIRFVPWFNMYRMKIRGRKGRVYFLPTESTQAIYGFFHAGEIKKFEDLKI